MKVIGSDHSVRRTMQPCLQISSALGIPTLWTVLKCQAMQLIECFVWCCYLERQRRSLCVSLREEQWASCLNTATQLPAGSMQCMTGTSSARDKPSCQLTSSLASLPYCHVNTLLLSFSSILSYQPRPPYFHVKTLLLSFSSILSCQLAPP
jgi:hypothetical protein